MLSLVVSYNNYYILRCQNFKTVDVFAHAQGNQLQMQYTVHHHQINALYIYQQKLPNLLMYMYINICFNDLMDSL